MAEVEPGLFTRPGTRYLQCSLRLGPDMWKKESTGYTVEQIDLARQYRRLRQREIDAQREHGEDPTRPVTVAAYVTRWIASRRELRDASRRAFEAGSRSTIAHRAVDQELSRLRKHLLPYLGTMNVSEVKRRHVLEWVHKLRTLDHPLSPSTLTNMYRLVATMFADAVRHELIEHSPFTLSRDEIAGHGAAPASGGAGRYRREDLVTMISDPRAAEHARVFVALGGLAGLRIGAICGLRWGDLDVTTSPLARLTSSRTYDGKPTKTGIPSVIPVHPILAGILTSWRAGWSAAYGREPTSNDPIVARIGGKVHGTAHTSRSGTRLMHDVLAATGIPAAPMLCHALRSTFISIAIEDGADEALIARITHPRSPNAVQRRAFDTYDRADRWAAMCRAVASIRLDVPALTSPPDLDPEPDPPSPPPNFAPEPDLSSPPVSPSPAPVPWSTPAPSPNAPPPRTRDIATKGRRSAVAGPPDDSDISRFHEEEWSVPNRAAAPRGRSVPNRAAAPRAAGSIRHTLRWRDAADGRRRLARGTTGRPTAVP